MIEFEKSTYRKIKPLKNERENLWRAHKRAKTDDEKKDIEERIIEISKQISPIDKELRFCGCALKRAEAVKKAEVHKQLEMERNKSLKDLSMKKEKCR